MPCTLSHDIFILRGTDDIQVFLDDIIVSVVNAGREGGSDKTRVAKEEGGGGREVLAKYCTCVHRI